MPLALTLANVTCSCASQMERLLKQLTQLHVSVRHILMMVDVCILYTLFTWLLHYAARPVVVQVSACVASVEYMAVPGSKIASAIATKLPQQYSPSPKLVSEKQASCQFQSWLCIPCPRLADRLAQTVPVQSCTDRTAAPQPVLCSTQTKHWTEARMQITS